MKVSEKKQKGFAILLVVMMTMSIAGLTGVFGTSQRATNQDDGGDEHTANVSDALDNAVNSDRVGCSTGDAFSMTAQLRILADDVEQVISPGVGDTGECKLEIFTEDDSGLVHIVSDSDKGFVWQDFFDIWGVDPLNAPGYILLEAEMDGEVTPGQEFDFGTSIADGQSLTLKYVALPDFSGGE